MVTTAAPSVTDHRSPPRYLAQVGWAVLVWTLVVHVALDALLLQRHVVKMETANASQLELHALARDGLVVLTSAPSYYAEALHHWVFHLLLLVDPRLEVVAALLNIAHYGFAAVLFVGTRRRLGVLAALVATSLFVGSAVAPILSKHVIPTAFVPLVAPWFCFAVLDLASGGGRNALGRAVVAFGALLALNVGHVLWLLPLVVTAVRARVLRPPWWAVAGFIAVWSSGILRWVLDGGPLPHPARDWAWVASGRSLQRLLHIEGGIEHIVPAGWGIYPVVLVAFVVLAVRWDRAPAGLLALLVPGPFLVALFEEADVSWQTPLVLLIGWAATAWAPSAWATLVYTLAFGTTLAVAFERYAAPPNVNFLALSTVAQREIVVDVLVHRLGLRAGEVESLRLEHRIGETGHPALEPGMAYLFDRVLPPLPPGGDRCVLVDDVGRAPDAGAIDVERVEAAGLVFQAWRGVPCASNLRTPHEPLWMLDLSTGRILHGVPPTPRRATP